MIIYVCNHPFPDSSGFARRCAMEIDALSKAETVIVYCRTGEKGTEPSHYNNVIIHRFSVVDKATERIDQVHTRYRSGWYELWRNLRLFTSFCGGLYSLIRSCAKEYSDAPHGNPVRLYVVNAPLTIPLFAWFVCKVSRAKPHALCFHDLEPEMAMHIKHLKSDSLVIRITRFLEKTACRLFGRIIVTNNTQKAVLVQRTGIASDSVQVLPNITGTGAVEVAQKGVVTLKKKLGLSDKDYIAVYLSNLSYDYTISGLIRLIQELGSISKSYPALKLIIAGDGPGTSQVHKSIKGLDLDNRVIMAGRISNVPALLASCHVGIIPWTRDGMTEQILPTKMFEYMEAGLPVLAPSWGECVSVLKHGRDGLLSPSPERMALHLGFFSVFPEEGDRMGNNARAQLKAYRTSKQSSSAFTRFITRE